MSGWSTLVYTHFLALYGLLNFVGVPENVYKNKLWCGDDMVRYLYKVGPYK